MPGGKAKIRRKKKGQDKDVSFRFHSSGSLESGAYLSEGNRESPAFSDSLDELEEEPKHANKLEKDSETSSTKTDCSIEVGDQEVVRELLQSAIDDDISSDATHPLSDPLFDFDQEPFIHPELDKRDDPVIQHSIQTSPTKELEYKETYPDDQHLADSEGFSDSGDFMNIKDSSKIHRLLDSDDEELFFSLTKETITNVNETTDNKLTVADESDYAVVKSDDLESDNDSLPAPVSPFKDNTSMSDAEDTTVLAEVETHPLVSTGSVEAFDEEAGIKDSLAKDEDSYKLLLTEEHFSNIPAVSETPKKSYQSPKVKPKRPPPPRPPLPSKMGKPNIVVSDPKISMPSRETGWDNTDDIIVKPEPFVEETQPPSYDEEKTVQVEEASNEKPSEVVRDDSLTFPYFMIYTLVIFLYYSLNPSSYLAGFLAGFLFFFITSAVGFIWYVDYLLSVQQKEREAVQKSLELSSQNLIDQLDDTLYFKKVR